MRSARSEVVPRLARAAVAAGLLALVGCGLSDYESRMDAQQARLKILDEENRNLGDAIDQPKYVVKDTPYNFWPFEVFLRVPKNVSGRLPTENAQFVFENLSLFRYAGPDGYNVFVAAGNIAEPNKENKYKDGEWPPDLFKGYVREALKDYYRKTYRVNYEFPFFTKANLTTEKKVPINDRGVALPPLEFEMIRFKDSANAAKEPSEFRAYFHHQSARQVGVIYQFPANLGDSSGLNASIDWSIKSLNIMEPQLKRAEFEKRQKFRR
jgi:hypothetical protein